MPLPLLWIGGAAIGAALLADERQKRQSLERRRALGTAPKQSSHAMQLSPSIWQASHKQIAPDRM